MKRACGCELDDAGNVIRACPDQKVKALVGRKPCGCAVAAAVADGGLGDGDSYAEAARWARLGWTVEQRTVGWVRHTSGEQGGLRFDCPHDTRRRRRATREREQLTLHGQGAKP
jgi:hypothetical protein